MPGRMCAMSGCNNNDWCGSGKSFFRFPSDPNLCKQWIEKCSREDLGGILMKRGPEAIHNVHRVCSDHFSIKDLKNPRMPAQGLLKGSVPSLNLAVEEETMIYIKEEPNTDDLFNCPSFEEGNTIYIKAEPETDDAYHEEKVDMKDEAELVTGTSEQPSTSYCDTVDSVKMTCYYCGNRAGSLGKLRRHIAHVHWETTHPQPFGDHTSPSLWNSGHTSPSSWDSDHLIATEKRFHCSLCSYRCRWVHNLKRHIMVHSEVKPCVCTLCNFSCREASNLKRHMLLHFENKPFRCPSCSYSARRAADLKQHALTHTGEKPFQCLLCSYSCRRGCHLKKHMLKHEIEKQFQCTLCSQRYREMGNLEEHMFTHTGEKSLECSDHLKVHMWTDTEEKP